MQDKAIGKQHSLVQEELCGEEVGAGLLLQEPGQAQTPSHTYTTARLKGQTGATNQTAVYSQMVLFCFLYLI